jgi:general secretion pathway protein A
VSAVPSPTVLGDPVYEAFYGLREQPFAISTDPKFLFLSAAHQKAYQELLTGLQRKEPLLLLTGEAGTGKTTLCRALVRALGDRTFSAIVQNPYMKGPEVLKMILREFGLISGEDLRVGALARADSPQLMDALEGFLLSLRSIQAKAVVVADEAQSLAPPVLDQLRLLTGLERNGEPLIQVMLGGQPPLLETLKKENLYALNERISRRVHLAPLLDDEVRAYIEHRLSVAGGSDVVRFDEDAVRLVTDFSRGLPRRVNLLCDRALHEGRLECANVITGEMLKRAARSLAGPQYVRAVETASPPPAAAPAAAGPVPVASPEPVTTPDESGIPAAASEKDAAPATVDDPPLFAPVQDASDESVESDGSAGIPISLGSDAPPAPRGRLLVAAAAALAIFLLAGTGAGYVYAQGVLGADPGVPDVPRAPQAMPDPLGALPVPPEEELLAMIESITQTVLLSAAQLPENRD